MAFASLPADVTTLDLDENELGKKTGAELATAFSGLSAGVTTLNLSRNGLGKKTGDELATAFSGLSAGVTTLDLSRNGLGEKTGDELATAFSRLSTGLTTLDLSRNGLGEKTGDELATAFSRLSTGLTTLDLSRNGLGEKTGDELATAFSGLPAGVTTLDLSRNDFDLKTDTELAAIFSGLPNRINTLEFSDLPPSQQVKMILSLPASITTIIFDGKAYKPDEYLLGQIFPMNSRESYWLEETIEATFAIDEPMLQRLIAYFNNHSSAIGHLVCGLLLEGRIQNMVDESPITNRKQYLEERSLAAISCYHKAACDLQLKGEIEFIVWRWRTVLQDNDPIKQELNRYKLSPKHVVKDYHKYFQENQEGLLDFSDTSQSHIPKFRPVDNSWLLLKIGLSISLAGAAIMTLCLFNVTLITAVLGASTVAVVTYATCRFFENTQQEVTSVVSSGATHSVALAS